MKPSITNPFLAEATQPGRATPSKSTSVRRGGSSGGHAKPEHERADAASVAPKSGCGGLFVPLQADLRDADFGYSLELSPMLGADAVASLQSECSPQTQFLVSMEQTVWHDGRSDASLSTIAHRLGLTAIETIGRDQLVLDFESLRTLVTIAEPTRLLVVGVNGAIDVRDAHAMNRAIESTRSPLTVELRAFAALEVLGDRSVVLHTRQREAAIKLVAQDLCRYLEAVLEQPGASISPPDPAQIDHVLRLTGALTVRPMETSINGTAVDVGVNTSLSRFTQPANLSLVFDRPSNTWHME